MTEVAGGGPYPAGRAGVERTVRDLVLRVVQGQVPTGVSIVVEGAPGIGQTYLARAVVDAIAGQRPRCLLNASQ